MVENFKKYRDAAVEGIEELEKLVAKKKAVESEISKLSHLIAANIAMLPASQRSDLGIKFRTAKGPSGLKDAVYRALSGTKYMSAADVRDSLLESGYDLEAQVNPLASVSTTLRRFEMTEEPLVESKTEDGKTVYRRKGLYPLKGLD
ncbi:MAG: hypothetical protein LAP21_01390 [Acidobacteriia bacterium]|nr:hypothetical protein [Terriglobia bacterium]